jgi:hypothetical protein
MNFLRELIPLVTPLIPLLTALIWPITILIILYVFRHGIVGLIRSLAEARVGDRLIFKFWQAKSDLIGAEPLFTTAVPPAAAGAVNQAGAQSGARWEKVASVFWLGSDLDWTAQTVLRGAPKERIVHGLTQSCHHAAECGLSDAAAAKQLAALRSQVQTMQDAALDREWRANFVEQLYTIIRSFSDLAKERQGDFRAGP